MKSALLFVSLAASPACAEEVISSTTSASKSSTTTTTLVVPATASQEPSVLDAYGIVSSQQLVTALDANLTSAQRAQVDQAMAARNAALVQANRQLAATLREVTGETNQGLNKRMMAPAEAQRMEAMRRAQPARYLHLMNKRRQKLKNSQ